MVISLEYIDVQINPMGHAMGNPLDNYVTCGAIIPIDENGVKLEDHSALMGFTGICRESELISIISERFGLPESAIRLIQ